MTPRYKFFSSAKGEVILGVTQVQCVPSCLIQRGRAVERKPGLLRSYNGFEELVSRASWEEAKKAHQVFVLLF